MTGELETAGAVASGGWLSWRRKHAEIPPGTPCGNCETPLQGAYCHTCGQMADDFHKSIWKLAVESFESLFHFDGRMWRTLPDLLIHPGRLTRAYLDGKRAYQIPPFRLFLVLLLIAFFVGHAASKKSGEETHGETHAGAPAVVVDGVSEASTDADRDRARARIMADPDMSEGERQAALALIDGDLTGFTFGMTRGMAQERAAQAAAGGSTQTNKIDTDVALGGEGVEQWVESRLKTIQQEPGRFMLVLEIWAHRVAILALPISALFLTLLFVFQRRFFVFDHLVFSMHSLSFQLILLMGIMILGMALGSGVWWLTLLAPVHLFVHMRGVYTAGIPGTLLRMALLWVLTVFAFTLLAALWLYLGIAEMGGH